MTTDLGDEPISYSKLYSHWEKGHWSAASLDFSVDKEHSGDKLSDQQREAALWYYAMFLVGEESVARTLSPVMEASPLYEQRIFLSTQIVDEARHHFFFDSRYARANGSPHPGIEPATGYVHRAEAHGWDCRSVGS